MPEINEYYCKKCGTKVDEEDIHCTKCKSLLAGNVKIKKIKVSETKLKILEGDDIVYNLSHKESGEIALTGLNKFVYYLGWIGVIFGPLFLLIFLVLHFTLSRSIPKKKGVLNRVSQKFVYGVGFFVIIMWSIGLVIMIISAIF